MGKRRDWSHGVRVERRTPHGAEDRGAGEVLIRRIRVRYGDGRRTRFVPGAGEEFFSRDEAHRVVGVLHKGSETLEWGPVLKGESGAERQPGTGPYDTGAV